MLQNLIGHNLYEQYFCDDFFLIKTEQEVYNEKKTEIKD